MATENAWRDPPSISSTVSGESERTKRRRSVEQAVANAYSEQHQTTPLDAGGRFTLQSLEAVPGEKNVYEFRVKRMLGWRMGGSFRGRVRKRGDRSWAVEYEQQPGLFARLRALV